jgi:hypothetical protein
VYTSYDYVRASQRRPVSRTLTRMQGAAIAEDRTLREKYYELKLLANFLRVSPAYTTTRPQNIATNVGAFTGSAALKTTQTLDVVGNRTGFYVVRQADASSLAMQMYKLTLPTSAGKLALPALGGSLMLTGRDSKIHVVDYAAGSTTLLYSTGEIATWATVDGRTVVVLYGNKGETHETAVKFTGAAPTAKVVSGSGTLKTGVLNGTALAIQYTTTGETVVQVGSNLLLYIVGAQPCTRPRRAPADRAQSAQARTSSGRSVRRAPARLRRSTRPTPSSSRADTSSARSTSRAARSR